MTTLFFFECAYCGYDSNDAEYLAAHDYSDCFPCPKCQPNRDVEMPMKFRPASKLETATMQVMELDMEGRKQWTEHSDEDDELSDTKLLHQLACHHIDCMKKLLPFANPYDLGRLRELIDNELRHYTVDDWPPIPVIRPMED